MRTREFDPLFEDWKARARDADILDVASRVVQVALKKRGRDYTSACPTCGGRQKNEFICTPANPANRRFLCRKSGEGGDAVSMVMHALSIGFMDACEAILCEPPPKRGGGDRHPKEYDPALARERREERRDAERARDQQQKADEEKRVMKAGEVWAIRQAIRGSHADRYLAARKITLTNEEAIDLAFHPRLPYFGFRDPQSDELVELGAFPAMLAAVRDVQGNVIAVHRTYLDPEEPRKLRAPGDASRNLAKKVVGKAKGGMIRLGYVGRVMAIGEGIETTLSFARLGIVNDDIGLAAAYSLGNLSGSATGTVPHPDYASRSIPNGIPDMDQPGIILPPEVEEVILLGDGDSDPATTKARLLVAARRFAAQGKVVSISNAPKGRDFNDVLIEREGA